MHTLGRIFSDFSYVFKLTTVHVNQSRYDLNSVYQKERCCSSFQLCQKSKGHSSELTKLLQLKESKFSEVRLKIKRERNEDIVREVHSLGQLDNCLFSLKFETARFLFKNSVLKTFCTLGKQKSQHSEVPFGDIQLVCSGFM